MKRKSYLQSHFPNDLVVIQRPRPEFPVDWPVVHIDGFFLVMIVQQTRKHTQNMQQNEQKKNEKKK